MRGGICALIEEGGLRRKKDSGCDSWGQGMLGRSSRGENIRKDPERVVKGCMKATFWSRSGRPLGGTFTVGA